MIKYLSKKGKNTQNSRTWWRIQRLNLRLCLGVLKHVNMYLDADSDDINPAKHKILKTGEASKSEIQYDEDDKEDGDEY